MKELLLQDDLRHKLQKYPPQVLNECIKEYYVHNINKRMSVYNVGKGAMLAKEYLDPKKLSAVVDPEGWYASEKFDGMRALWDGEKLMSRNNKPINAPEWFLDFLPSGVALDGELFTKREDFQKLISYYKEKSTNRRGMEIR